MLKQLIGALIALLVSGLAWSAPCAPNLPERSVPLAGTQWMALSEGKDPDTVDHEGPMWPKEVIHPKKYKTPDMMTKRGYEYMVGMLNAVTVYPCRQDTPSTIEFKSFEIIRLDPATNKPVVEAKLGFAGASDYLFNGWQFARQPQWFVSANRGVQPGVLNNKSGVYAINLSSVSEDIVHLWMNPRLKTVPNHWYGVRALVRVAKGARLQLAMDFYRDASTRETGWSEDCVAPTDRGEKPQHCEAGLGDWVGDTKGEFREVVFPHSIFGRFIGNSH